MATSGKKAKKNKWKPLDTAVIINTSSLPVKPVSWAEESEIEERERLYAPASRAAQNIVLPSAPRASIDAEEYERKVPHEGPYMAYLSNLSFDIVEEDIVEFFQELRVANIDLPRDDRSGGGRCKGYGHVEFEDRASLIDALGFIDASIKGRRVRIDLPNAQDERQNRNNQRGYNRDRNNQDRDRPEREETSGDWRAAPRAQIEERRPYGGRDSYNRDDRGGRSPRRGGFRSEGGPDSMTRDDFGTAKPAGLPERSRGAFTERTGGRDAGGGGGRAFDRSEMKDPSQQSASPEREFTRDRPSRDRDTRDVRSFDRTEMQEPRSFDRTEMREPPKDLSPPSEPKTRPKLNLAPRTKPIETPAPLPQPPLDPSPPPADVAPAPQPTPKPSAASIFGGAKPVDTAAREREIEEKLKAKSTDADQQDSRSRDSSPQPKENEQEAAPPTENVWARRSQQLSSNISNGVSPDSTAQEDTPTPHSDNSVTDSNESRPVASVPSENDENRQPSSPGWRESGPRQQRREFGTPRDNRDNRDHRDSRDNRDHRDSRDIRDSRNFRPNDDKGRRPIRENNRDSNNRDRDGRGPPPRKNFDSDRPRHRDDDKEIRRNPNNTRDRDTEIRRGGGRPGAPNKDGTQGAPASTGPQSTPAQADPAKPKPNKKPKEVDPSKMPKVQEKKGIDFAQGNKFSLLPDEEGEEVDEAEENI